jgi:hypothetical protein
MERPVLRCDSTSIDYRDSARRSDAPSNEVYSGIRRHVHLYILRNRVYIIYRQRAARSDAQVCKCGMILRCTTLPSKGCGWHSLTYAIWG